MLHAFPPVCPQGQGQRPLRPALRRVRPGPGPHRGGVGEGHPGEDGRQRDPHFQARATVIKEQRAELAKHHVSVLWSDYFKAPHFEKYPELHQLVNDTLKALSAAKASTDPATGQKALDYIAQIDKIFWETKKA